MESIHHLDGPQTTFPTKMPGKEGSTYRIMPFGLSPSDYTSQSTSSHPIYTTHGSSATSISRGEESIYTTDSDSDGNEILVRVRKSRRPINRAASVYYDDDDDDVSFFCLDGGYDGDDDSTYYSDSDDSAIYAGHILRRRNAIRSSWNRYSFSSSAVSSDSHHTRQSSIHSANANHHHDHDQVSEDLHSSINSFLELYDEEEMELQERERQRALLDGHMGIIWRAVYEMQEANGVGAAREVVFVQNTDGRAGNIGQSGHIEDAGEHRKPRFMARLRGGARRMKEWALRCGGKGDSDAKKV